MSSLADAWYRPTRTIVLALLAIWRMMMVQATTPEARQRLRRRRPIQSVDWAGDRVWQRGKDMLTTSLLIAAAVSSQLAAANAGPGIDYQSRGFTSPNSGVRQIATPRAFPTNVRDSLRRSGFGGRMWISASVGSFDSQEPGASAYGAHVGDDTIIYGRIAHLAISMSPWQVQSERRLEAARQEWLKENNFTGGVRSFVNDASLAVLLMDSSGAADAPAAVRVRTPIAPRGVIEVSPEATKFRQRMQVRANPNTPHTIVVRPATVVADAR